MTDQADYQVQIGTVPADPAIWISVVKGGPYIIHGAPPLHMRTIEQNDQGQSWSYRQGAAFVVKDGAALCRCGQSRRKPYCDGSHQRAAVDLTETASFEPMLDGAVEVDGPEVALTDNEHYCTFARFCDSGQRIWTEVQSAGRAHRELAEQQARNCPGGRLIVWDVGTRQPVETPAPATLSLIEDPAAECSGPLALDGGIRVESADGRSYEIRNRQALCRCGASSNKPFCDGSHASIKFVDGL